MMDHTRNTGIIDSHALEASELPPAFVAPTITIGSTQPMEMFLEFLDAQREQAVIFQARLVDVLSEPGRTSGFQKSWTFIYYRHRAHSLQR